jgi:heat shock protein HtpX
MSNRLRTAALLGLLSGLVILVGEALGGSQGLVIGFLVAAVSNLVSYWYSDTIVLRMYRAEEVGPEHRLYGIVHRLVQRAGLPQPRCYVIPQPSPNAFATGRGPQHAAVAATAGILDLLDDRELEGVLAHELAHVKHRDILTSSVAATLAAVIMVVSRFVLFWGGGRDGRRGAGSLSLLATLLVAPVAAALIQAAISRSREFDADAGGAAIAGGPDGLMAALAKIDAAAHAVPLDANPATAHMFIVRPFSGAVLMNLFSTHPPTPARIEALRRLTRP